MSTAIRRSSWTIILPMAAGAVGYVMLVFLPGQRAVSEVRDQIEQKEQYVAEAEGQRGALDACQQELTLTEQYVAARKKRFASHAGLSALYGRIQTLAKTAGAAATRFDPEPMVALDTFGQVSLALGYTGTPAQLGEFLQGLERFPEAIWVKSLVLEGKRENAETVQCNLVLEIFVDNPEISGYANKSQ